MTGKKKKFLTRYLNWALPVIRRNLSRPSHIKDK